MAIIASDKTVIDGRQIELVVHSRTNPPDRLDRLVWTNEMADRYNILYTVWNDQRAVSFNGILEGASGTMNLPNLQLVLNEFGTYDLPDTWAYRTTLVGIPA